MLPDSGDLRVGATSERRHSWPVLSSSARARSSTPAATRRSRSRSSSTTAPRVARRCPPAPRPGPSRRSSCVTARARYGGKGVSKAVLGVIDQLGPELIGYEASEQRLIDQAMLDLDGTDNKSQDRRQRHPRCLAGGRPRRCALRRPAALPLRRRPERPPAAGPDDEHRQRRRSRRLRRRRAGVHDRPDRRCDVPGCAGDGGGRLPHPEVGAEEVRATPPAWATRAASRRTCR